MSLTKQDMQDIKAVIVEVVNPRFDSLDNRFDSLDKRVDRLDAKVTSNHMVNTKHHLDTRKMIGDQNKKNDQFREDLAKAVGSSNKVMQV